jgi:PIN domain nuclease of toxin-antitoxin system
MAILAGVGRIGPPEITPRHEVAKPFCRDSRQNLLSGDSPPLALSEQTLKVRLGKLPLSAPFGVLFPAQLAANRVQLYPLEPRHIEPLTTLPFHHKDPFDRLLVAIVLVDKLDLVSADAVLDAYGITRVW